MKYALNTSKKEKKFLRRTHPFTMASDRKIQLPEERQNVMVPTQRGMLYIGTLYVSVIPL